MLLHIFILSHILRANPDGPEFTMVKFLKKKKKNFLPIRPAELRNSTTAVSSLPSCVCWDRPYPKCLCLPALYSAPHSHFLTHTLTVSERMGRRKEWKREREILSSTVSPSFVSPSCNMLPRNMHS